MVPTKKLKIERAPLGALELEVMKILWNSNQALDVHAVAKTLGGSRAYTTVMTTLNRLSNKGYLTQHKEGRAFLYRARVNQDAVLQKMLSRIAKVFYNGDIGQLVPQVLGLDKSLTRDERERLKKFAEGIQDFDNE